MDSFSGRTGAQEGFHEHALLGEITKLLDQALGQSTDLPLPGDDGCQLIAEASSKRCV